LEGEGGAKDGLEGRAAGGKDGWSEATASSMMLTDLLLASLAHLLLVASLLAPFFASLLAGSTRQTKPPTCTFPNLTLTFLRASR